MTDKMTSSFLTLVYFSKAFDPDRILDTMDDNSNSSIDVSTLFITTWVFPPLITLTSTKSKK
jgi:hypothetical protein